MLLYLALEEHLCWLSPSLGLLPGAIQAFYLADLYLANFCLSERPLDDCLLIAASSFNLPQSTMKA